MVTRLPSWRCPSWADVERALPLLWLGLLGWALYHVWILWDYRYYHTLYDYQAFYCGAKAVLAHANPYLNQPLHACEAAVSPELFARFGNITIPNPLPGYAFALFLPLALASWPLSAGIWTGILVAAIVATIFAVHRLTERPFLLVAASMSIILAVPSVMLGSLAPLPILFTVLAAYALKHRRWTAASVFLALGMIEPHVMLPACAAVFLFVPAMRYRLCVTAGLLAIVSVMLLGANAVLAYPQVLSVHALSEVSNTAQYSLTWLLHDVGVPAGPAVLLGTLQYLVMGIAGVAVARRLATSAVDEDLEFYVTAPIALAIIGGNFIHITQMGYAVPLLFGLDRRHRTVFVPIALLCLALPWQAAFSTHRELPLLLFPLLYIIRAYWRVSIPALLAIAGILVGAEYLAVDGEKMVSLLTTMIIITVPHTIVAPAPSALADTTWGQYFSAYPASNIWIPDKLLTWAGLIAMLFALRPASAKPAALSAVRQVLIASLAALVVCTVIGWPSIEASFRFTGMGDFRAFTCAASVAAHSLDPYVFGALYRCESSPVHPSWFYTAADNIALPAPLPPYALAPFAAFTHVAFPLAARIWQWVIIGAAVSVAFAFSRTTSIRTSATYLLFCTPAILALLPFGELTSVALFGMVLAAYCLTREWYWGGALALAFTTIEPHIALPMFVGLFVANTRMRAPLLVTGALLVVASLAFVGPHVCLEYVTAVLPLHVISEIGRTSQLSLSSLLFTLGVPARVASMLGDASFVLMALVGIVVGRGLSRRYGDVRFTVYAPAAAVLLGGPFIHITQMIFALPFVVLLLDKQAPTSTAHSWLTFAAIALAIPWESMAITPAIAVPCFAAGLALLMLLKVDDQIALVALLATGAAWFLLTAYPPPLRHRPPVFPANAAALAEQNWASFVSLTQSHWDALSTVLKIPTWIALITVLVIAVGALRTARAREALVLEAAVVT